MGMITHMLVLDEWYELADLDDAAFAVFQVQGNGVVRCAFGSAEPDAAAAGFVLREGLHQITVPTDKAIWLRLTSGTADVVYSQADVSGPGTCEWVWTDPPGVWEGSTDLCADGYVPTPPVGDGDYDGEMRSGTCELP